MSTARSTFSTLRQGSGLQFTPYISRGANGCELTVDIKTSVPEPETQGDAKKAQNLPFTRVSEHRAVTTVRLQSLDVFGLSSFSLGQTRAGRRPPSCGACHHRGNAEGQLGTTNARCESIILMNPLVMPMVAEVINYMRAEGSKENQGSAQTPAATP